MRAIDPGLYAQLLSEATGPAAKELAARDPDAYVAMHLSAADDAGHPYRPKERGLSVAYRIDGWRASAELLRGSDPSFYAHILSQADGTDQEDAARGDPDGYVALDLSQRADAYAQNMRAEDPRRYEEILSQAVGSAHEEAARRDPDAYVGISLAEEAEDAEFIGSDEKHES